jgi:asparagine synthase (glutamine-hydrolysing)
MSGIVGIVHSDGATVKRELLLKMTRSLAFRGPDAQPIWIDNSVGLGHAAQLMRGDATRSTAPETLGTGRWITADVRLDARDELVAALRARGHEARSSCNDSQLLLHAYEAWGEESLQHVFGDFAFILWDKPRQQLFCACDQFGIRQLYFAQLGASFVCSNTLDCLRLHPKVSARLNDAAIADFLLFGLNQCENTTSFADIQRLPRGHFLRWSAAGIHIEEYWRPPTDGCIRYKKREEYVEHFDELLSKAVRDRTRGNSAGILLSGGLDSSAVAAFCRDERRKRDWLELHAFNVTTKDHHDTDDQAARTVANSLEIPLHCMNVDSISIFEGWDSTHWPEPLDEPLAIGMVRQFAEIAEHVPVILSGEGADNLMEFEPWPHLKNLWREKRRLQAVADLAEHAVARFRAPDGLRGPLRRIRRNIAGKKTENRFPNWLNPDFVNRLNLKARWLDPMPAIPWNAHPQHPLAYGSLFYPQWSYMFEREDPAFTKAAVEVRYPFLDLRIVEYLLAIPAMPWFFRKLLLRDTVRQRLPEEIRKRPKIPAHDPLGEALRSAPVSRQPAEGICPELGQYVNLESLARLSWAGDSETVAMKVRPWCLNFWLRSAGHHSEESATVASGKAG